MLNISLEQKLKQYSEENIDIVPLWESWKINKQALEKLMQITLGLFPHYSLHDASHCKSILNNIEMILGNKRINELSPTDIWILLNSIYAHDIGMIGFKNLKEEWNSISFKTFIDDCVLGKSGKELQKYAKQLSSLESHETFGNWAWDIHLAVIIILAEYYRPNHAEHSALSILNRDRVDLSLNGLIPVRFIVWITKIIQSHGTDFNYILNLNYQDNGFCRDYIHPRFLSALLCLGDALDMDNSRFHPHSELLIEKLPPTSEIHRKKHEAIRQLHITPDFIEISADCGSPEDYHDTYRTLRSWCDMLTGMVNDFALNWQHLAPQNLSGTAPLIKNISYYIGTERIDPKLAKLKFEISQKRAFEIIKGSNIYKSEFGFIRELLQNAMDASKIQFWLDIQNGFFTQKEVSFLGNEKDFQPYHIKERKILERYKITVSFQDLDETTFEIKIIDKGTGLSDHDISDMSQTGQSYRISEKKNIIESMPKWLKPTANFGIGLQAVFLVCDEFKCETRSRMNGTSYNITFHSRENDGYLDVARTNAKHSYGSQFIIKCKNNTLYIPKYPVFISGNDYFENSAFSLYNEIDIFTQTSPTNLKSRIGMIEACNYISMQSNESFIPVQYLINQNTIEIKRNNENTNIYNKIVSLLETKNTISDDFFSYFDSGNVMCSIWNKKEFYYADMSFNKSVSFGDKGNLFVFFKDIRITDTPIRIPTKCDICFSIHLFGYDANEILELNRERLTKNGENIVERIYHEIYSKFIQQIADNINDILESLSEKSGNSKYVWYSCLKHLYFSGNSEWKNLLDCKLDLCEKVVYCNSSGKSEQIAKSIKDYFMGLVNSDNHTFVTDNFYLEYPSGLPNNKNLDELANRTEKNDFTVFPEKVFSNFLTHWYDEKVVFGESQNIGLRFKVENLVQAVDCDSDKFFELLLQACRQKPKDTHSILSVCIKPFDTLSLSTEKIKTQPNKMDFWQSVNQIYIGVHASYMIIPLSSLDICNISSKNYSSKDVLITSFTESERYQKILEFTIKNQFTESKYTLEEIDSEYKALLSRISDILNPPTSQK